MKKILILITVILSLNACVTVKKTAKVVAIKFQNQKFEEALAIAKEQDKIMFIDFWATWCGPCKRMDAEVLSDPALISFFNKNFINFKLDADSEDAILPKINYDVRSIPTYIWVDGDGNMVYEYKGTTTIQHFMILGENALINGGKTKL
tara:strand:+ start:153 stop:599 length:447 start_codon:yes stop_codon:yes gene_type:complete